MKLFVWNNPYPISYGGCKVIAIAANEKQARNIIAERCLTYGYDCDDADVYEGHKTPPRELGPVSRVVDLPCAEFHWWSE